MRPDQALVQFLIRDPNLIHHFIQLPADSAYAFDVRSPKRNGQRLDACCYPLSLRAPFIALKLQGSADPCVYFHMLSGMGWLSNRVTRRDVYSLLIFIREADDPKTEPWHGLARSGSPVFQVIYLKEVIDRLRHEQQDHPLAALFDLLVVPNLEQLSKRAQEGYRTIQEGDLPESAKATYTETYMNWLIGRVKGLAQDEAEAASHGPFEDSHYFRNILAREIEASFGRQLERLRHMGGERGAIEALCQLEELLGAELKELREWRPKTAGSEGVAPNGTSSKPKLE